MSYWLQAGGGELQEGAGQQAMRGVVGEATGGRDSGQRATGGRQQVTGELLVHKFVHRATSKHKELN